MKNINTALALGLNHGSSSSWNMLPSTSLHLERSSSDCASLEPSLTLGFSGDANEPLNAGEHRNKRARASIELDRQLSPDYSANGRPTTAKESVKSERVEGEKSISQISQELLEEVNGRKKLRLTKEQSALLEDKFKEQITLNPRQKQALAKQLKLQPRQVEVWFQNRRARTKFKQTKVECEVLRNCCETLMAENRRLRKELKGLKALTLSPQLYMQPSAGAANYTVCPSCERIMATGSGDAEAGTTAVASKPGFFKSFAHSAACK